MIRFVVDKGMNIRRHARWEEVEALYREGTPFFVDVTAPDQEDVGQLRNIFHFHPTHIEDCTTFSENPKMAEHKEYTFTVIHSIVFNAERNLYEYFDIHVFVGENYVVTVHEKELDVMREVRERLLSGDEKRELQAEYAYYVVLDSVVDSYYPILTYWSARIDEVEELVYDMKRGDDMVYKTIPIRKGLLTLKRSLMLQKEVIYRISHTGVSFIGEETRIYLRDVYDHICKAFDTVEEHRDILSNLMDAYFSKTSAGMNEVMKRLTVISTIFMPLTFIVGVYGMNFNNMPELAWRYGYYIILGVMVLLAGISIWYTKRKKWF